LPYGESFVMVSAAREATTQRAFECGLGHVASP
jgi:hypothetical protein